MTGTLSQLLDKQEYNEIMTELGHRINTQGSQTTRRADTLAPRIELTSRLGRTPPPRLSQELRNFIRSYPGIVDGPEAAAAVPETEADMRLLGELSARNPAYW